MIEKVCDNWKFSSNINEVVRVVLNSLFIYLFIFYEKILHAPKAPPKALKDTKTLKQKYKNANKWISDYFPLRCFLRTFLLLFTCKRFVFFVLVNSFQ